MPYHWPHMSGKTQQHPKFCYVWGLHVSLICDCIVLAQRQRGHWRTLCWRMLLMSWARTPLPSNPQHLAQAADVVCSNACDLQCLRPVLLLRHFMMFKHVASLMAFRMPRGHDWTSARNPPPSPNSPTNTPHVSNHVICWTRSLLGSSPQGFWFVVYGAWKWSLKLNGSGVWAYV